MENFETLDFKQGGTFSLTGTVYLTEGLTWEGTSQLRDEAGGLIRDLRVTLTPLETPTATETHAVVIDEETPSDTSDFPLGQLFTDVFFTADDGTVTPSDTYVINVIRRWTVDG